MPEDVAPLAIREHDARLMIAPRTSVDRAAPARRLRDATGPVAVRGNREA